MSLPWLADVQAVVESLMVTPVRLVTPPPTAGATLNPGTFQLEPLPEQVLWSGLAMVVDADATQLPGMEQARAVPPGSTHRIILPLAVPAEEILENRVVIGPDGRYTLTERAERGTFTVCWIIGARKER